MIDSDLIAFLGTLNTGAGVHLGNAPQDCTYPVVVVRNAGSRQRMTTQGTPLFHNPTFSIHVLHHGLTPQGSGGYDDALPIAWTVHNALRGFRGMMGGTRVAVIRIASAPRDISEIEGDKVTRWLQQDVVITHY